MSGQRLRLVSPSGEFEEQRADDHRLRYCELHCLTNFSFQRGASHPEELVARAHALGYSALAITDECSVAGVVRAHVEARKLGLKLMPGAEFILPDKQSGGSFKFVVLARNRRGWGNLCEFITEARCKSPKGHYTVSWPDGGWESLSDCEILLIPSREGPGNCTATVRGDTEKKLFAIKIEAIYSILKRAKTIFRQSFWLGVELPAWADDAMWLQSLSSLSSLSGVPLVAAGNVHIHVRSRKPLLDVIASVHLGRKAACSGLNLQQNAELHMRRRHRLAQIYPLELLDNTCAVAERCSFSLDELRYQYPMETVLPGLNPEQTLRRFTYEGASTRYPDGLPSVVRQQVEHELALIAELEYEMYFLTVHDIVHFACSKGILCQGRGSAANSAVCYCLGITEVDPAHNRLLFERFISRARSEPPDIDVDFEHDRREEVIQYIYRKYGHDRAAIAATVVTYRSRSAIRDAGMALGVDVGLIDAMAKDCHWFDDGLLDSDKLMPWLGHNGYAALCGAELETVHQWLAVSRNLMGFPRHLSQHVGGFVLTQDQLTRMVPVENAAMPARSIIQWDKDDLDAVGMLKVDVLALGMLSAIRRCLDLVGQRRGEPMRMQDVPTEDAATYDMICKADTVGVFQIESRAQMSMLPRLRPREFYDLVIEVAIVRPGPIQGGMVHPYLKNREHPDAVPYPYPPLRDALERTLGIPIFQEQVMQIAMIAADFSPDEADDLRRSMAAWRRKGGVHRFHGRLVGQMVKNGYAADFAEAIFRQMLGFGEYGFPESHAVSFAWLAYVSSWLKCHEPACFLAALLNSQPMGFYRPAQLVYDARRHGVEVRAIDVVASDWSCTLEGQAVRLGLCLVAGLSHSVAGRILAARKTSPFINSEDLAWRAGLGTFDIKALADADALLALSGHRRLQMWDAAAFRAAPPLLAAAAVQEDAPALTAASESEEVMLDYVSTGLTLRQHPLSLLRSALSKMKLMTSAGLRDLPSGRWVAACGIVTARQQPQTAKGVVFVTLEDETGSVNVIVWRALRERQRAELLQSRLLAVYGQWQRNTGETTGGGEVRHLVARRLKNLTPLLGGLATCSRDFR